MKLLLLLRGMVALEILVLMLSSAAAVDVDLSQFSSKLLQLTDRQLGIKQFQSLIDDIKETRLVFLKWLPDGQLLAEQISRDIDETVHSYMAAVRRIQTAYKNGRIDDDIELDLCCNLSNLAYDPRFKRTIDANTVCHLTRSEMRIDIAVKNAMINNLELLPNTKWQFYGTEDNLHCTYPARDMCSESLQFDPRVRPWYTTTLNTPRDIVILIDRSRSMNDRYGDRSPTSKLIVAKNAAAALVRYLNANDRVAVLAFSDSILSANSTSCLTRELAIGTEDNKNQLLNFINQGLGVDIGETRARFELAFRTAYSLFKTTDDNTAPGLYSDSEKIIVLLTDANQKEECQQIRQLEMDLFNNTVNIFTMGIGETVSSDSRKQACLKNLTAGPRGALGFVPYNDVTDLRSQLAFYYNAFIDRIDRNNVTFSVPFTDINGLGLHTAACLPLFLTTGIVSGVTCVEVAVDDIFRDIVSFRVGQLSYGFVIDGRGRVILHPLLPQPTYWVDLPTLVELTQVEISEYSKDIEKEILSGLPGNKTVSNVMYYTATGETDLHGVTKFVKKATYFWHAIQSMNFYMCLVIIEGELKSNVTWNSTLNDVLLSDRLDFPSNDGKCVSFNRLSSVAGKSVVKLAPKAFLYPVNYTERTISLRDISQLENYITRKAVQPPNLSVKSGIRDVVAATSPLESIWLGSTDAGDAKQHILSRYIGTKEGVYRRYPAIPIAKDFDPTIQPWYKTANSQSTQIRFSLPFLDYASKIPIISISKAVLNRRAQTPSPSDLVMGVIGMDVTVKYLYRLVFETIAQCNRTGQECFAIDASGFLVIHKDFQTTIPSGSLHIAAREKTIASELIENHIMTADTCINYAAHPLTRRLYWQTDLSSPSLSCQQLRSCLFCRLKYAPDVYTNLFLVVKLPSADNSTDKCACQNQADGKYRCAYDLSTSSGQCQCPCNISVEYDSCLGDLKIDPITWKPCIPSATLLNQVDVTSENSLLVQPSCLPCSMFTDAQLCEANNCFWLNFNSSCTSTFVTDASTVTDRINTTTTAGLTSSPQPFGSPNSQERSLAIGLGVGLPLGIIVLATVVGLFLLWQHRRRHSVPKVKTYSDIYEATGGGYVTTIVVKEGSDPPTISDKNGDHLELESTNDADKQQKNLTAIASVV